MGNERNISRLQGLALLFLLVIAVVSMTAIGVQVYRQNQRITTVAYDTHAALCSFKDDLQQRVYNTEEFLREHPAGIPGVPNKVLRQSIANQKLTIKSLDQLDCT